MINFEKHNLEEKLALFKNFQLSQDELIRAIQEISLLKGNILLQNKLTEEYKFKYEALYQGIFASETQEELSQSQNRREKENKIESIEDVKSRLAKVSKKLYFYEEDNKLAWKRIEEYKCLLNLREEELCLRQKIHKEDEIRIQRVQCEMNYLFQVNKLLGDINQIFSEYAQNKKTSIPSPPEEFVDRFKDFMNQMHIFSIKALKQT